ncbi:MAG: alpha/beta hydrolase, partial [Flavitalea sp.]
MKILIVSGVILLLWLILAQSCMTFRTADGKAKETFAGKGIQLITATIKVDDYPIHFVRTGNDSLPTIFFIHGSPGSWTAFEDYLSDSGLLKKFRMVSIDRPGFGYSNFGEPRHLARQSELISPVFNLLRNGKPFFLAGHSLGGPMVVKLAADNPGIFSGLAIISGSFDPTEEKPEKWRPVLFNTPLNYFVPGAMRASNIELWYLKKDLVDLKNDFQKITCPVFFIHGLEDTWVPPGNVAYAEKLLVNASEIKELMIPGANHFIPWS